MFKIKTDINLLNFYFKIGNILTVFPTCIDSSTKFSFQYIIHFIITIIGMLSNLYLSVNNKNMSQSLAEKFDYMFFCSLSALSSVIFVLGLWGIIFNRKEWNTFLTSMSQIEDKTLQVPSKLKIRLQFLFLVVALTVHVIFSSVLCYIIDLSLLILSSLILIIYNRIQYGVCVLFIFQTADILEKRLYYLKEHLKHICEDPIITFKEFKDEIEGITISYLFIDQAGLVFKKIFNKLILVIIIHNYIETLLFAYFIYLSFHFKMVICLTPFLAELFVNMHFIYLSIQSVYSVDQKLNRIISKVNYCCVHIILSLVQ